MAARFLVSVFCLFSVHALAQTFEPVSGNVLQQEVFFGQANECFIHFKNNSADSLRLKWRRLEISNTAGWKIDLCDYGNCYTGIPSSGLMNTLLDTAAAYLKLIVLPGQTPGAAWLWFRVLDNQDDSNFQDVFFSLHTPGVSDSESSELLRALQVFPNPVSDILHLKNTAATEQNVRLFDLLGRLVFEKNIPADGQVDVPTDEFPAGNYWLQTGGQPRKIMLVR